MKMSKEIGEINNEILRVTQNVVVHTEQYSNYGGYEGERDIYTMDIAKALYNANYRKQSEVIDDFVERLKNAPIKCSLPLFGLQTKGEIAEHFNGIMLQFGNAIDNIAKEMKGGAE